MGRDVAVEPSDLNTKKSNWIADIGHVNYLNKLMLAHLIHTLTQHICICHNLQQKMKKGTYQLIVTTIIMSVHLSVHRISLRTNKRKLHISIHPRLYSGESLLCRTVLIFSCFLYVYLSLFKSRTSSPYAYLINGTSWESVEIDYSKSWHLQTMRIHERSEANPNKLNIENLDLDEACASLRWLLATVKTCT